MGGTSKAPNQTTCAHQMLLLLDFVGDEVAGTVAAGVICSQANLPSITITNVNRTPVASIIQLEGEVGKRKMKYVERCFCLPSAFLLQTFPGWTSGVTARILDGTCKNPGLTI